MTINITRKLYIYQIIVIRNILITIVRYLNYGMNINTGLQVDNNVAINNKRAVRKMLNMKLINEILYFVVQNSFKYSTVTEQAKNTERSVQFLPLIISAFHLIFLPLIVR